MSEQIVGTAKPRGRRAAQPVEDFGVPKEYVDEVLSLAGGLAPNEIDVRAEGRRAAQAHLPAAPTHPDEPARAAVEDDVVDFDKLSQNDTDRIFNFDFDEEEPEPAPQAGTPGAYSDFAVYGDGGPAAEPAAGPATTTPEAATKVDTSRVIQVDEEPSFYADPSDQEATHNVRFRKGSSLSSGNRNVFRADYRGVPIFSPGWNARKAAKQYLFRGLSTAVLALLFLAASAGLVFAGVATNPEYLALKENGTLVNGTVVSVVLDSGQATDEDLAMDRLATETTEQATVEFELDGQTLQRVITTSSETAVAVTGVEPKWTEGQTLSFYLDPADPTRAILEDPAQWDRINWVTLAPLPFAGLFLIAASMSFTGALKMRKIAASS